MAKDGEATYYDAGGIETIEIIKAKLTPEQYQGFLLGNALKYQLRMNFKQDAKHRQRDVEKAANYINWLDTEIKRQSERHNGKATTS